MVSPPRDITALLRRLGDGDRAAGEDLYPLIYEELRRLARMHMRRERPGHTLQATALVHEAYLRLMRSPDSHFSDRRHFFAVAARVMRNVLVDYARGNSARKRDGGERVDLERALTYTADQSEEVLAVHEALQRLEEADPRQARIVEMRFFAGMSVEEIAETLGISVRSVKRDWNSARAWLYGQVH